MDVLLKPELEKFVADKVRTLHYADASDIVNEALKEREEFTPEHEIYLRREVGRGLDELRRGQCRAFDAETIIAQERQRLRAHYGRRAVAGLTRRPNALRARCHTGHGPS
jgi:Arc/MetJ-type ribon-helix-helix transcriptional regulator